MNTMQELLQRLCVYWPQMFDLRMTPATLDKYMKDKFGRLLDATKATIEEWEDLPDGGARCKVVFDVQVRKVGAGEDNIAKLLG